MKLSRQQILEIMNDPRYPRSCTYDPDWILSHAIGSHCLWLMESLSELMDWRPGQRVLDIGCGKAISSIFLPNEFQLQVWALDRHISATANYGRIQEAGVADRVFPLQADAHQLPFADAFFDAIVGINSFQLFSLGSEYYQNKLVRNLKAGGKLGFIVPGIYRDFDQGIPEYLQPHVSSWLDDFLTWKSPQWWERHLSAVPNLRLLSIDTMPENEGNLSYGRSAMIDRGDDEDPFYNADQGRNITFLRVLTQRAW